MTQYEEWEKELELSMLREILSTKEKENIQWMRDTLRQFPRGVRYIRDENIKNWKRAYLILEDTEMVELFRKEIVRRKHSVIHKLKSRWKRLWKP